MAPSDPLEVLGADLCRSIVDRLESEDAVKTLVLSKGWSEVVGRSIREVAPDHALETVDSLRSLARFVTDSREGVTQLKIDANKLETPGVLDVLRTMAPHLHRLRRMRLHLGICSQSALLEVSRILARSGNLEALVINCTSFRSESPKRNPIPAEELAKTKRLLLELPLEGPVCVIDCLEAFPAVERCTVYVSSTSHARIRSSRLKRLCVVSNSPVKAPPPDSITFVNAPQLESLNIMVGGGLVYFERECSVEHMRLWSNVTVCGKQATVKTLTIEEGTCLDGMDLKRLDVRDATIMAAAAVPEWDSILFQLAGPETRLNLSHIFFTSKKCFFDSSRVIRDEGFCFEHATAHVRGIPESDVLGALTAIGIRCPTRVVCHHDPVEDVLLTGVEQPLNDFFLTCPRCADK